MIRTLIAVSVLAALAAAPAARAHEKGDLILRVGAHTVDPKSDNGTLAAGALAVDVGANTRPTFAAEWMLTDNLGLDVLASLPFKHNIKLNGTHAGSTKHLPPTVSLQWHFNPRGTVQPYLGAGINYTLFSGERSAGPIAGTDLDLGASWGLAAHAGIDFRVSDKWLVGFDARWIDIDTKVRVNGADVGTVNIDPIVFGAYVGYRF
ncbi:MAG: OmpW family protein [Xanthomonadales bacterium]|nr:OmpW family protein [Xanthomonadales bacterium]